MVTAEFFKNKKILIVAAHPDDELLGLGASMHHLIKQHHVSVDLVILGEGITSRADTRDADKWQKELEIHRKNILEAGNCIGYSSISTYNFPDNRFDSVALLDIVKVIEKEKKKSNPDVIFTHHEGDLNIDHRRTYDAVITACRPMEDEQVKTIIAFETPSATEWQASADKRPFAPNVFFTVTEEDLQAKINGMEKYRFEKRAYPHPRSPKALRLRAQYTGMTIGREYAEPFCLIRHIEG